MDIEYWLDTFEKATTTEVLFFILLIFFLMFFVKIIGHKRNRVRLVFLWAFSGCSAELRRTSPHFNFKLHRTNTFKHSKHTHITTFYYCHLLKTIISSCQVAVKEVKD
jgi:hypothetical protein